MKKFIKITLTIFMAILILLLINNYVKAASTDFTKKLTDIEVDDTITVTAEVTATQWDLYIKVNGKVIASSSELDNYKENITKSFSGTYKATEKGTLTITLEGDITDFDQTNTIINKTKTITVKEKSTSNSTNEEGNSGSGSSNNDNSSGGGDSSTGTDNSTDNTPKPTFTSKNETVYATTDGINVRSSYTTSSTVLGSLNEGDSLTRTGIATKSIDGILWSKVKFNGKTAYVSSAYLTTTKPKIEVQEEKPEEKPEEIEQQEDTKAEENKNEEKSNNTNLKSIQVTPTGLSPAFSNITTEYTMEVDSEIDKIEIEANVEDEKAKVTISGNNDLKVGTNIIKILVTAEDGTEKTYNITVTKKEKEQLKLKELLIEGLPLNPKFDSNIYEYNLQLDSSDVSELNITATANNDNAEIEIVGSTELKSGENVVTILVKSLDGEEITTYQITVNVPEKMVATVEVDDNLYLYIGIGIVLVIILVIIITIKRSKKNEYEEEKKEESVDELSKLNDEDLPKSLRKKKKEELEDIKEPVTVTTQNKKLDELYNYTEENIEKKKKGKHF